jgi:hemerythrin
MLPPDWKEPFRVNIHVLDEQHRKYFDILANLYDAVGKGYDATFLGIRLMELSVFVGMHFDTEELMMSEYHYPGYEEHRKEHELFREKVAAFQEDLKKGKASLSVKTVSSWTDWLEDHITNFDKKYSSFLNGKGIH